jgi:hypothetical protein
LNPFQSFDLSSSMPSLSNLTPSFARMSIFMI